MHLRKMGRKRNMRKVVIVAGSFVLHILSMGVSQSFGVIYKELLLVFEVGEGEIGWVASLFAGLLLGSGIIAGILVSEFGVSLTAVVGSLLMTTGMVASAFVSRPFVLYLTYGVIAGCGASLLLIAANVVIAEEFTDRRTVAMGIASSGGSIGNIILPLFTLWCIETYDWRGSFLLLGGLCLQGAVAGVLFYNGQKRSDRCTVDGSDSSHHTETLIASRFNKCLKYFAFFNIRYICFVIASTIGAVGYFIPYNLLYSMMTSMGHSKEYSSLALSLSGVGSIVSRVLIGFIGDFRCWHRMNYFVLAVFICATANVVCVYLTRVWEFLAYAVLYGMGTGVFAFLMSIITADLVGVENVGPAFGFLATIQGIGASIGTPAGGWLAEATSSYNSSFYFSGACFLVCGLVSIIIPLSWHCVPRKSYRLENDTYKTHRKTDTCTNEFKTT